ncbi:hypothetical protein D1007_34157 [Hordeum vulgare]|nr:hypothetical protein D1007_34157 [Hordeum vulgare]
MLHYMDFNRRKIIHVVQFYELRVGMDEGTTFMWDENYTDKVTNTGTDIVNEDDDSNDNDLCSLYDILSSEDFGNNKHGANSENVTGVYSDFIFDEVDVDNVQNNFLESFSDNLSQEESDGTSGDHDEADMDTEEAQRQQKMLEMHWIMAMTFRSQGDA